MKRNSTQAEYQRRIGLAIKFIEQHLEQTIRLDDVARASHFSPYHFHRIFHALVGETVNDYISRKRMEKAVRMLMYKPQMSVTEIAMLGGFSSSANFSKAFKLYFGISPTELRLYPTLGPDADKESKIGKLYSKYGKAFKPQDLYSQFVTKQEVFDPDKLEELLMKIKVEKMPDKPIAYLSSPQGYKLDSVYATWDKLLEWAKNKGIDHNDVSKKFALCHDSPAITPEDKCRYDASIVIEPDTKINEPFHQTVIPAGQYAKAYYKGEAEKINNFMTEFCSRWLVDSGYEPDNYPSVFNYLNDSRQDGFVEMNVYIKLKELSLA